ncbi:hypothetical protein NO1_1548 [Candidatus Termititenax aidoneus]|uniref:Uncharacterized protein n=1 Tax=Termititenax aidoneus TaxID=2218524 RepID=A0A388TC06_TERA1|nr:hypothetical protein NO1_1548 [Candidatus Termititenax aidoneus]
MKINWQKTLVFLTILALGLTLAGCGKTASGGGSSGGGGGGGYNRSNATVTDNTGLIDAINNGTDDIVISVGADIAVTNNATLNITVGQTLTVADGASLNVGWGAAITLNGTITVESGAVLVDDGAYKRAPGVPLGPWQKNETASIVFKAGAQGHRYHPTLNSLVNFVGDDSYAIIELKEGELILKRFEYELYGDAEIHGPLPFEFNSSETAIVKSGSELILDSGANIVLNGSIVVKSGATLIDTSARLWFGNGNGTIVFEAGSSAENNTAAIGTGQVLDIQSGTVTLYNPTKVATNGGKIYEIDGTVHFNQVDDDPFNTWVAATPYIKGRDGAVLVINQKAADVLASPFDAAGTYNWSESTSTWVIQ